MAKIIQINKLKKLRTYEPLMSTDTSEQLWQGIEEKLKNSKNKNRVSSNRKTRNAN